MKCLIKNRLYIYSILLALLPMLNSCNKKDYPCPGLGQSSEADMSLFDESGQLKESKKQKKSKDKSNGLVIKKQPKRLRAPRKTHI